MQATSDLLALIGMRRLNWPPLRFNGAVVNTLVAGVCGGVEVWELARGERSMDEVAPRHVAAAAAWFVAVVACVVAAYTIVAAAVGWSVRARL